MTFNFLGPGLTVNVEAKVKEQIILDSSALAQKSRITMRLSENLRDLRPAASREKDNKLTNA